jgi:Zn-dependent peptidase ImmA (M78 family)
VYRALTLALEPCSSPEGCTGKWGVFIKMLVARLRQLGRIEQAHATSLYKQISKRGWNKTEPVPVSNETLVWFEKHGVQERR